MLIYNVTTNIEQIVHEQWLQWMKETHIPDVLATGKFLNAKLAKVLVAEEMGGHTYSVQFTVQDRETLERYYKEDAPKLRDEAHQLFPGKFVSFRTELEVISEKDVAKETSTQLLFAYGTLRDKTIQQAVFSKTLMHTSDTLFSYALKAEQVADTYPNIVPSKNREDHVVGEVYPLTENELRLADSYEGDLYERITVTLASGRKAWVYVSKDH